MSAVLRIRQTGGFGRAAPDPAASDPAKAYLDRLVKLIPAEVVGLYLAGKSMIQAVHPVASAATEAQRGDGQAFWIGWTLFCFLAVIAVRAWATSDRRNGTPVEWPAVGIAAVSFLIWIYSMGDAFAGFDGVWQPLLGGLLVLGWTFVAPLIYRTPPPAAPARANNVDVNHQREGGLDNLSARRPGRRGGGTFSEGDAEQAVLDAAERSGRRPSLGETVSDVFSDATQVRQLLGWTQDVIADRHGIWVDLASGSDHDMKEHGKATYRELSSWVHGRTTSRG